MFVSLPPPSHGQFRVLAYCCCTVVAVAEQLSEGQHQVEQFHRKCGEIAKESITVPFFAGGASLLLDPTPPSLAVEGGGEGGGRAWRMGLTPLAVLMIG